MAGAQLPGAEIARSSETDAGVGGLMGKPRHAEILVAYSVGPEADAGSVKAEAVARAQDAGWNIGDPQAEVVTGTKRLATGEAEIGIYFVQEEGEDRLIIRLEHGFTHPG